NAAGRLQDMSVGIECLLSDDADHALSLASQLDALNHERKAVEASMQQDAIAIVEQLSLEDGEPPAIYCLADSSWHEGVVGLVASRIKERTNRPVVALAPDQEGNWKGSARSVEGLHIRDLLARVDALHPGLMNKFGGHAMAAGLSVEDHKREKFVSAVRDVATQMTAGRDWSQVLWSDGRLAAEEFTMDLAEQLRQSSPWGQGFPEPLFDGEFEVMEARVVGEIHAKFRLRPIDGQQRIDAICFGYLQTHDHLPRGMIRAAYRLDNNEFRERINLQLLIQHIEPVD
ncbi:MAG: hypothetical protein KJP04_04750, partial [Arenicella sp.]|nr:hypothetical protein [Arenicella sp.]